ncbi:MAG TPA: SpoIIE family protein phosphatase [Candidatus Solibacter sp.]|nr:SpoIIE family protein phosphatase [Candidatus Solibacter sp.]
MSEPFPARARSLWRSLTPTRRVAAVITILFALASPAEALGFHVPGIGLLRFLFSWALFIWFLMLFGWVRRRVLWSLRNRLLVAYLFIAVVPIILLLCLGAIAASILYAQLGSYVLSQEVNHTLARMEALADTALSSSAVGRADWQPPAASANSAEKSAALSGVVSTATQDALKALAIPGLEIQPGEGSELLPQPRGSEHRHFMGLVQRGDRVWLRTVSVRTVAGQDRVLAVSALVTPELLDSFSLELGRIRWDLVRLERTEEHGTGGVRFTDASGGVTRVFVPLGGVSSQRRSLPPRAHLLDLEITGFSNFEAVSLDAPPGRRVTLPVIASFYARPSRLNRVLFASLGDLSSLPYILMLVVGGLFLVIEAGALVTGAVLTRTITRSVSDLYRATQRVKAGDLSYRIRDVRADQLGALAASFNEMTVSVARAIEEQRQRERLENELSIAREVQNQLFPRSVPRVPGLHLVASCRAARMVSGDYYDFIRLSDAELAFIVADIAGKGISAALLMASLQASLRSQLFDQQRIGSTADVITRLNRHLLTTTPEDRFATLFFAIYNSETRLLRYTNAGHLPPLHFSSAGVTRLDVGGTIVGMFAGCEFEQGSVSLEPGSLLAAYTDGISEPENAYGEQFGRQRIIEVIERNRSQRPEAILDSLVVAVEQWAGSPEQADDMTILLATTF